MAVHGREREAGGLRKLADGRERGFAQSSENGAVDKARMTDFGNFHRSIIELRQAQMLSDGKVANHVLTEHLIDFVTDFLGGLVLSREEQADELPIQVTRV
jgi:hypothetical protein